MLQPHAFHYRGAHVARLVRIRRLFHTLRLSLGELLAIHSNVLLVDVTPGSLAILDDPSLRLCRNSLMLSVDVVLGLLDVLVSDLLASDPFGSL